MGQPGLRIQDIEPPYSCFVGSLQIKHNDMGLADDRIAFEFLAMLINEVQLDLMAENISFRIFSIIDLTERAFLGTRKIRRIIGHGSSVFLEVIAKRLTSSDEILCHRDRHRL